MEPIVRISPYLQEDWIYLVLLILLSVLAVVRYSYPKRMVRLAQALVRDRMLHNLMRENMVMSHRTAISLFLVFIVSSGLLAYLAVKSFAAAAFTMIGFWLFPAMVLGFALIYTWKIVTVRLVQFVFGANGGLSEYLNYSFVMNALLGIVWLPVILVVVVTLPHIARGVIVVAAVFFALAWLVRIIKGIQYALSQRVISIYIILYLCALEIMPLAVIAKGVAEVKF